MKIINLLIVATLLLQPFVTARAAVDPGLVQNVDLVFCNDESVKRLHLNAIQPNQPTEICISLTNNNSVALPIALNFVDGVIASDGKNVACRDEADEKRNFAKFVTPAADNFTLAAGQTIKKLASVNFPEGFSGMSYGCVTYFVTDQAQVNGALNVLVRKANVITAKVGGKLEVGLQALQKSSEALKKALLSDGGEESVILAESEDGRLIVRRNTTTGEVFTEVVLASTGNVKLDVILDSKLTGGGLDRNSVRQISLLPGEQKVVRSEELELPIFGGSFSAAAIVSYRPVFEFESADITEELRKPVEQNYEVTFFVFPWRLAIFAGIFVFILSLIRLFILRRKKLEESQKTSYTVKPGDTIESIAGHFGCSWHDIARINGLKAPYTLKPNTKIQVLRRKA